MEEKLLSIVITHYKEPVEVFQGLFNSIAMQQAVDLNKVELIIVQDGEEGREELFRLEPIPTPTPLVVRTIQNPHGGVSKARNRGLDEAVGEYVMFCDCDDKFYSLFGLWMMFRAMESKPDIISSSFTEESLSDGDYHLIRKDKDITFVHGKAYRRAFLKEENLRFKDELTIHEDGYFNSLVNAVAKTKQYIDQPFYLWCWNPNSVVRKDRDNFLLKTYTNLLDARDAYLSELVKRGYTEEYKANVVKCWLDIYYDFNTKVFIGADPALKKKAMLRIKDFWKKYKSAFMKADGKTLQAVSASCRMNAVNKGMSMESISMREFIALVENFKS